MTAYFRTNSLTHDIANYDKYYSQRAAAQDIAFERKLAYLKDMYNELVESKADDIIACYYDDGSVEIYSFEEFVEQEIDSLDDEEFYY